MCPWTFLCGYVFSFHQCIYLGVKLLGHMVAMFDVFEKLQIIFQRKYTILYSPPQYMRALISFHLVQYLLLYVFLIIAILVVVKWYLTVVLICISPRVLGDVPGGSAGKDSICGAGDLGSIPGLGRSPGEGNWLPTPVFWPGEFHGRYSLWVRKEVDTTERLSLSLSWPSQV